MEFNLSKMKMSSGLTYSVGYPLLVALEESEKTGLEGAAKSIGRDFAGIDFDKGGYNLQAMIDTYAPIVISIVKSKFLARANRDLSKIPFLKI